MIRKMILNLMLVFALFLTPIQANAEDISNDNPVSFEDGLIGYWNFDNGELINHADPTKNGKIVGSGVSIETSDLGKSLKFNGDNQSTFQIDSFINTGTGSYAISLWYKLDADSNTNPNENTVLVQQDGTGRSIILLKPNNKYDTFVNAKNVVSDGSVDRFEWQHIAINLNIETNEIEYYINGEFDSKGSTGDNSVNALTALMFGRHKNPNNEQSPFKGFMDEIMVHERVLTPEEIKTVYKSNDPHITFNEHLIGYYDFNEDAPINKIDGQEAEIVGKNLAVSKSSNEYFGSSLKFEKGNDSYLKIKDAINTGKNPYTISMWYKAKDASSNQHSVLLQQSGSGRSVLTSRTNGAYGTFVSAQDLITSKVVNRFEWQHVAISIDPTAGKFIYFINGEQAQSFDMNKANLVDALTDLMVGLHKAPGGDNPVQFVGEVDELRIYDAIIDKGVIKSIYEEVQLEEEVREPIMLEYNKSNVTRVIDDSIFGVNHRYGFNGYGMFDQNTNKVKDDFKKLYQDADFGSVRYPGGTISNLFSWKDSIGETSKRPTQIHGFYDAPEGIKANLGLNEMGVFAEEVGSELVYVYGLGRGNASDAADLIEYLNAEVGTNPNGGIAWADVRAANGHPEPFNVRYFEIGNEMQQDFGGIGGDGSISQAYWTTYGGNSPQKYVHGGNITFDKQPVVEPGNWNSRTHKSNGEKNQVKLMRYANLNPNIGTDKLDVDYEAVVNGSVKVFVAGVEWQVVDDIKAYGQKNVVQLNMSNGELYFGDGTNGNIPAKDAQITVSYNVKKDGFIAVSEAMRETMRQINEGRETEDEILIYAGHESDYFINEMKNTNNNHLYDGLTIHPYSGTPQGAGEDWYNSAMSFADSAGIGHVKTFVDKMPEGKVPVISEYGIFRSTDALVRSQTHALYISKVLMNYVELGSPYIQKHTLVDWYSSGADSLGPTQQAVIQAVAQPGANTATGEGEYKFFSTPSAHVFEMFNKYFGKNIIDHEVSNVYKIGNNTDVLETLVSKDNRGNTYVAMVNLDVKDSVTVGLKDLVNDLDGVDYEVITLNSESFADENSLENPENVKIETHAVVSNVGGEISVELAPHSLTIVKILDGDNSVQDTSELAKLLAEVKELNLSDYKTTSSRTLKEAIKNADKVLTNEDTTIEDIEKAINDLNLGVSKLVSVEADDTKALKEELTQLLKEVEVIDGNDYTETSFKALSDAIVEAQNLIDSDNITAEQLNSVINKVTLAKDSLVTKEQELIESYKAEINNELEAIDELDKSIYTDATLEALDEVVEKTKVLMEKENVTSEECREALNSLESAKEALTTIEEELIQSYTIAINEKLDLIEKLDKSIYTESSVKALNKATTTAKNLVNKADVTSTELETALENLSNSYDALVTIESEVIKAFKNEITDRLKEIGEIVEKDYTADSYKSFIEAKEAAEILLESKDATVTQLEKALEDLNTAYANLTNSSGGIITPPKPDEEDKDTVIPPTSGEDDKGTDVQPKPGETDKEKEDLKDTPKPDKENSDKGNAKDEEKPETLPTTGSGNYLVMSLYSVGIAALFVWLSRRMNRNND